MKTLNKIIKNIKPKIKTYLNRKVDTYARKDLLFLAGLFHDIAKKETTIKGKLGATSCPNHEKIGSIKVKGILNRFDLSNKEKNVIAEIIKNHGEIHHILNPDNKKMDYEYKNFKSKYSNLFLDLIR